MNKKIVVGGVIVAAVVAGGVGYGVTHTAKAQFASHMLSMFKSDDNVYKFSVNSTDKTDMRVSGKVLQDAKKTANIALTADVTTDGQTATYDLKKNAKHTYVSAGFLGDVMKMDGATDIPELAKVLKNTWLETDNKSYSKFEPEAVKKDAQTMTKWFTDLDGKKFKKVTDGYQVTLKKADYKSFVGALKKTETAKTMKIKAETWKDITASIDDLENPKLTITMADKGHQVKVASEALVAGKKTAFKAQLTTTRNDNQSVKMPTSEEIKTQKEFTNIITAVIMQYAFQQMGSDTDY
ncbi:hypothetical protein [Weissella confusa]|uniref:hypothetical protein n=1 Tax=Weissella confusa TaxID=1583 RepID=UPI001081AEE6|nr:hypothetical protein [Weissella confusa]TGE50893.1 hypothetical protein C6P18_08555 [Weissella confusa]TGE57274.1 hypothetical protein C6P21_08645 [Weissella confusa]TGE57385.1 hypothetical protein C6P19_08605 [Weissella confusa]